jgi:hypothetical protein
MNWLKFSILSVVVNAVWYALFAFVIWEPDAGAWPATGSRWIFWKSPPSAACPPNNNPALCRVFYALN